MIIMYTNLHKLMSSRRGGCARNGGDNRPARVFFFRVDAYCKLIQLFSYYVNTSYNIIIHEQRGVNPAN